MSYTLVSMPAISSNEDRAELTEWLAPHGAKVEKNQVIAVAETTKTTIDVIAGESGILHHVTEQGGIAATGEPIGFISHSTDFSVEAALTELREAVQKVEKQWTKKAELVANKLGLKIEELAKKLGRTVTEADVLGHNASDHELRDLTDDKYPATRRERVLLIGGGGGGGTLAVDAIQRTTHQRAVGILDNNAALHGKTMLGVPILGPNSQAKKLYEEGFFDAAIIMVTANLEERERMFTDLRAQGIPFTNVIDPSVEIRANVTIGTGNLIMANGFLAACVTLGDNNFLASHTCIEHHSIIGNHCTFGPRSTTSGAVVIGDKVKFGMGVLVEPYLTIGSHSLIPSGAVVTAPIPANSVLKMQSSYKITAR